jgi:hypothetical protein
MTVDVLGIGWESENPRRIPKFLDDSVTSLFHRPTPPSVNPLKLLMKRNSKPKEKILAIHHPSLLAGKDENVIGKISFFSIGESQAWDKPIHALIKPLRDKYGLKWLRVSMSYHNFSNLGEKFNSDLQSKVMREIDDKTYALRRQMVLACVKDCVAKLL